MLAVVALNGGIAVDTILALAILTIVLGAALLVLLPVDDDVS